MPTLHEAAAVCVCTQVTYFLRGLRGMRYVLSQRALLTLAVQLVTYPSLHQLAAKVGRLSHSSSLLTLLIILPFGQLNKSY